MSAHELSALLWRERELLETLIFKLEEEQLLLTSGKTRWLKRASAEIERTTDQLRFVGLGRTVEVENVAEEWGGSEGANLRELLALAPEGPWADIFEAHLKTLTELTSQIRSLRDANEQFLRAAARSSQETLSNVSGPARTYDSRGKSGATQSESRILDRDI
jgi:hypothetical protein